MARVNFGSFGLDLSPDWTLSSVILAGPVEDPVASPRILTAQAPRRFQQNIIGTMEQVGPDETPESYVKRQRDGLREAGVEYREAAPPEKVQLANGLEGLLTEHVVVGPGGDWVHQMQLVSIKDRVAHTIIASHLDGPAFQRAKQRFREILLSFG